MSKAKKKAKTKRTEPRLLPKFSNQNGQQIHESCVIVDDHGDFWFIDIPGKQLTQVMPQWRQR